MKVKKIYRISAISKILSDNPNKLMTLNFFSERFSAAKSTISSDIKLISDIFKSEKLGIIETVKGVTGGVKYIPTIDKKEGANFLNYLCEQLSKKERILPGGFLYLIDIIYNPYVVEKIARIFTTIVDYKKADYLVTIETKGIPMAIMAARMMNLPLLIIRKNSKISEGPSITITYVVGKTNSKMNTMSLPIKSIEKGSKVIILDDFMRGGGTIKGMHDLMKEFYVEVLESIVIISTKNPKEKKINNYRSLLELEEYQNENILTPSQEIISKLK